MRNELSQIETIERYLSGAMTANERRSFEALMKADPKLRNEVKLQQQLAERLQMLSFKEEMQASHNELAAGSGFNWRRFLLNTFLGVLVFCASAITTALLLSNGDADQGQAEQIIVEEKEKPVLVDPVIADAETDVVVTDAVSNEWEDQREHHRRGDARIQDTISQATDIDTTIKLVELFPDFQEITLHEELIKPLSTSFIDASAGATIETIDSKSLIHIPSGILVNKEGLQVIGTVEIRYREYRNPAEMVLSGIPMTYQEDGKDYNFNSAGMIEVRAYQDDEELRIKPGAEFTIDYNVTEQLDSCYFFALNDSTQQWTKGQEITFGEAVNDATTNTEGANMGAMTGNFYSSINPNAVFNYEIELIPNGKEKKTGTCYQLESLDDDKKTDDRFIAKPSEFVFADIVPGSYTLEFVAGYADGGNRMSNREKGQIPDITVTAGQTLNLRVDLLGARNRHPLMRKIGERRARRNGETIPPDFTVMKDSTEGLPNRPSGIYYTALPDPGLPDSTLETSVGPNLVYGLRCPSFGVYNCDQVQLVKNRVAVKCSYKDMNGNEIKDAYALNMINYNLNAAFGFSPSTLKFERNGKTVLLLFTKSEKVYALEADRFAAMNMTTGNHYTFEMTDITAQVKTTEQLKQYLGL